MAHLSKQKRETVLERDDRRCQFCGVTEEQHKDERGRSLDVHHIIPRRAGGSDRPENLLPVCVECHRTLESTQGDAIERLREQIENENENKEKIDELETELDEVNNRLHEESRKFDDCLNAVDELVDGNVYATIYVVHRTKLNTSELLYAGTSEEIAHERFMQADTHATMETSSIRIKDWLSELSDKNVKDAFDTSAILKDAMVDNPNTEVVDQ